MEDNNSLPVRCTVDFEALHLLMMGIIGVGRRGRGSSDAWQSYGLGSGSGGGGIVGSGLAFHRLS